jgi:hypothetical protein
MLITYLQVFYSCSKINFNDRPNNKSWITTDVRISLKKKGTSYLLTRYNNDMKLKQYYKLHCKILINGIKEAKRSNYNE